MTDIKAESVLSRPGPALRPPTITPHGGSGRSNRKRTRPLSLALMTAPALIWYGIFMIVPALNIFVVSTQSWTGMLATPTFAGLDNYTKILTDPEFAAAARNTAIHLSIVLIVVIPGAFMLGYYLNLKPRGHRILRVLFFVPALLSASASAMVFFGVFAPNGLLNGLMSSVGLGSLSTAWLANPQTSLGVVIFVDCWGGLGFTAILFAARMASVPQELFEAADLDGASHFRKMFRIAFPVIKGYVGLVFMLQFLWTLFGSASTVLLLTKGGPGFSSTTLSYMVYQQAFTEANIGYSQAIAAVLFAVGIVGMVVISRVIRQNY